MIRTRSFWWGAASVVVTIVGAHGPWARMLGLTVDGIYDEVVLVAASASGAALIAAVVWRERLAFLPVVGGLASCGIIVYGLDNRGLLAGGPVDGYAVSIQWGIWVALLGSVSMVLASASLAVSRAGAAPTRAAYRRLATHRSRPRSTGTTRAAARTSPQTTKEVANARRSFWRHAQQLTPYVAFEHRADAFLLPTAIGPKFFVKRGRTDFTVLDRACEVLRRVGRLREGSTIVDVGAHIGTTTIAGLTQQGFARAVAVEPDPAHLPLLRANIALNGLEDRVTVIAAAISDATGRRPFVQGVKPGGASRWMKGRLAEKPSATAVTVETVTLDALADSGVVDPARTALLWFDCGHAEEVALRSAARLVERQVPIVLTIRRTDLANGSPLVARLGETYEHAVDLRQPSLADPPEDWEPTYLRVEELPGLEIRGKLTDLLVF